MVVKTFRGILADDQQDRIRLSTIRGKMGYRIIKFQGVPKAPMTLDQENVLKIYKSNQSTIDGDVNFTDSDLLAVCLVKFTADSAVPSLGSSVIFDNEIVNQDIYVTHEDVAAGNRDCNYYIELEVIPLDDSGAEYTTLKDMRQPD
jgi:hypothetical protein